MVYVFFQAFSLLRRLFKDNNVNKNEQKIIESNIFNQY